MKLVLLILFVIITVRYPIMSAPIAAAEPKAKVTATAETREVASLRKELSLVTALLENLSSPEAKEVLSEKLRESDASLEKILTVLSKRRDTLILQIQVAENLDKMDKRIGAIPDTIKRIEGDELARREVIKKHLPTP